jgi:hypothetical protein
LELSESETLTPPSPGQVALPQGSAEPAITLSKLDDNGTALAMPVSAIDKATAHAPAMALRYIKVMLRPLRKRVCHSDSVSITNSVASSK